MATSLLTKYGSGTRIRGAYNRWMRSRTVSHSARRNVFSSIDKYNQTVSGARTAGANVKSAKSKLLDAKTPFTEAKAALDTAQSAQSEAADNLATALTGKKEAQKTLTDAKTAFDATVKPYEKTKEPYDTAKKTYDTAKAKFLETKKPYDEAYDAYSSAFDTQESKKTLFDTAESEFEPFRTKAEGFATQYEEATKAIKPLQESYDAAVSAYDKAFSDAETEFKSYQEKIDLRGKDIKTITDFHKDVSKRLTTEDYLTPSTMNAFYKRKDQKRVDDMTPEEKMEFEGIVRNRNPAMGPTAYDIGYTGDESIDSKFDKTGIKAFDEYRTATRSFRKAQMRFRSGAFLTDEQKKYLTSDEYTALEVGEMKDVGLFDNPKFKVSIENIMKNVQGYGKYRQDLIEKWGGDDFVNLYKTELETLSSAGDAYKKASAKYLKWAMEEPKSWADAQKGLSAKYDLENLKSAGSVAWDKLDKAQKHYTTSKGQYLDYIKSEDYVAQGKKWFKAKGDYEDAQTAFSTAKTAWEKTKTPYDTALSDFQATVDPFETASAAHQPNLEAYTTAEKAWKDALSAFTSASSSYTDAETASSTAKDFYTKAFKRYQSANTAYQSASQGFSTAQNLYNKYAGNTGYLALAKGGVGRAQSALTGAMSSMARFQSGYAGERTRALAGGTPRTARKRKRVSPLLGYA